MRPGAVDDEMSPVNDATGDMISAAIIVSSGRRSGDVRRFRSALTDATDTVVDFTELIGAPTSDVLSALECETKGALLLFCGHIIRGVDNRFSFTNHADEPHTPTALPIDAVVDIIAPARVPIVVIFDCEFIDHSGTGADAVPRARASVGHVGCRCPDLGRTR